MSSTRDRILETALDLFSQYGYSGVSIRDICGYVNIKESSLYYHFTNKQAILDEIINKFEANASLLMARLEKSLSISFDYSDFNSFENVCVYFFEEYLMDDYCNKVMRLLIIEQFNNEETRKIYDEWMFDKPLRFFAKVFFVLSDMDVIKNNDSAALAVRFYSPIFMYASRWLLSGELTQERKRLFQECAYKHMNKLFIDIVRI